MKYIINNFFGSKYRNVIIYFVKERKKVKMYLEKKNLFFIIIFNMYIYRKFFIFLSLIMSF